MRRESGLDAQNWRERLGEIDGQVGLLTLVNGAKGTGFLVAADLVLTGYHVLGTDGAVSGGSIRFDYKSLSDGRTVTAGTEFRLGEVLAANAELDFGLITVPETPGVLPVGGYELESSARPRGWIQVPNSKSTPQVGSGLVMAHHPQAGPLQLTTASDAVAGLSDDGRYLYHRVDHPTGLRRCADLRERSRADRHPPGVAAGRARSPRVRTTPYDWVRSDASWGCSASFIASSPWPDQIEAAADDGRPLAALRGS